ncbi:MAG TPA: hypothetical protein PLP42_01440 [Acidobacteriota bacterium]|nr:hypothetical protein [Acidobacteriota bacterium]
MDRTAISRVVILVGLLLSSGLFAQPRLQLEKPYGYQVGDKIDADLTLLDKDLQPHSLLSLIEPQTKILVLVGFGGADAREPQSESGNPLWCKDSFDDLPLQRDLVAAFRQAPVQFIGVAVPPVYNPGLYGYSEDAFLGFPETSPEFLENAKRFIALTEEQVSRRLIPFPQVFYDLKFRLADRPPADPGPGYGKVYRWQGKLRWHLDPRKYGLPIIWLIGPEGEILQPPFFSNDYDSDPPSIMYQFSDVKTAIEKHLAHLSEK